MVRSSLRKTLTTTLILFGTLSVSIAADKRALNDNNPAVRAPGTSEVVAPADDPATQLTKSECTKLGGTVRKYSVCKSGEVCSRTDENGKNHHVCISKKKVD